MPIVFIALGTNLGNRLENIQQAIETIQQQCMILSQSSIYETEPWGVKNQPQFLNAVIRIETKLEPPELLNFLLNIETRMGRNRSKEQKNGPRVIDLDILLYNHLELQSEQLTIPHPRMKERAFVLIPLYEICKENWIKEALLKISDIDKRGVQFLIDSK